MYLLDANVLINASRLYYAPEIAPTFWDWLEDQHRRGNISSVARVKAEIDDGQAGHLHTWAAGLPSTFWLAPGQSAVNPMGTLTSWAMHPDRAYSRAAREEFLSLADYYLVAQALGGSHQVVTFEQPRPQSKRRVLIPDACDAVGVAWREPFSIYRELGLRFS